MTPRNTQWHNDFTADGTQKKVLLGYVDYVPRALRLLGGDAVSADLMTPVHLKLTIFTTGVRKIGVNVVGGKC